MDEEPESCTCLDCHQNGEPKNELGTWTITADHKGLRHNPVNEKDDGLSFTCNNDSLSLLSVYSYARRIKSFLGWENILEEYELGESNQNSPNQNESSKKESFSSEGETLNEIKGNYDERLDENEAFCGSDNEISDDGSKLNVPDLCEISELVSERNCRSLNDLNENFNHHESYSDLSDRQIRRTSPEKIFRSEVELIIEDWRSNTTLIENVNPVTESSVFGISEIMDESLVQEKETIVAGLNLNDVDSILKDESHVDILHDIKCSNTNDECVKVGEDISKSVNCRNTSEENNDKDCDEDRKEEFKRGTISQEGSLKNDEKQFILSKDEEEGNLQEEVLQKNVDKLNVEIKVNNCNEYITDNSEELRKSLIDNVDKLVGHIVKEKRANNSLSSKNDRTLKAHIQYENEITKQPKSKDAIWSENQDLNRKDSIFPEDTECGFSIFRPRWLQPFATVKVYVILYSILGVLHGSYYSYLIGTLSTLEKRYAFKSKVSGAIMVADEITPLLLGVIIGYYAGKANRPRMIAFGMLLSAGCCFCSSLPYIIYGPVQYTTLQNMQSHIGPKFCDRNSEKGACDLEGRPPTLPAVLFLVFGSFLKGFGNLAYYAIGLAYLDDNSNKKTTPIYLAIAMALRLLGPLVGFLMSSVFLKFYENPASDPGYGPDDPRWVGAWWIGFFLQGVLLVIFTLPIALFPRRLPGQRSLEENTAPKSEDGFRQLFAGLLSALKRLGTNPVFVLLIVNTNMKIFGHFGHSIMLPKYVENQFRLSASEASLYSGATSIAFVMLATIIGGYLIWKFRPRIKVLLVGMFVSETLLCVGFLILMIPRCQKVDMVNFGMNDDGLILNSVCNQKCDCSTTSYTPFCGPEGTTYFSPCYAGCTQEMVSSISTRQHKQFRNCSCVSSPADQNLLSTISEGVCPDEKCWSQALVYLVIYFFLLSISNAFTVAHSMILLRSVHPSDKSIALGTFETFICLFGFIPFPVSFGALVDSACLVWENSCGETGNCWFYDMEKFSYLLHGVGALFCSFSAMCLIGLYFLSPRVRDLYVDDNEEKEYVDIKLDTVSASVTKL